MGGKRLTSDQSDDSFLMMWKFVCISLLFNLVCGQEAFPLLEDWLEESSKKPAAPQPLLPVSGKESENSKPVHPVVLVPGYMGSQLQYSLDKESTSRFVCPRTTNGNFHTLWLTLANHDPVRVNCWIENARMSYDGSTRRTNSEPGVTVQPVAFGSTSGVEFVSPLPEQHPETMYFYNLVRALEMIGYQKDVSVRGAPYDWRRAYHENTEFQTGFADLVESSYHENSEKPVVVICHSMGCTFTYTFLRNMPAEWKNKYIKSWIVIGAPMGGTFKYMYGYFADDDYPLIPGVRRVERTLSSRTFLLPRPATYADDVLVQSSSRNYTARDYEDFFQDLRMTDAYEMYLDTKDTYDDGNLTSPGDFPVICMGGVGQPTVEKAVVAGDLAPGVRWTAVYGDGDKFVNVKSMRRCQDFGSGNTNFQFREFRMDHMDLIKRAEPISFITGILNDYNARKYKGKSTVSVWPFASGIIPL